MEKRRVIVKAIINTFNPRGRGVLAKISLVFRVSIKSVIVLVIIGQKMRLWNDNVKLVVLNLIIFII